MTTLGAEYRRVWLGSASSNLADGITFVALPLLAATLTDSPVAISALAVAYSAPRVVSVLGVGVLIDRVDRRRLLHLANLSRAAVFALLTTLVIADTVSLAALYAVYAVVGVVETVSDGAALHHRLVRLLVVVGAVAGGLLAAAALACALRIRVFRTWEDEDRSA